MSAATQSFSPPSTSLQIQTIVSRERTHATPAVVTVGDIHGGTKRNIIPDEVKLEITARTFSDKARQTIIDGLRQMAIGIATSAALPPDKMPTVTVLDAESTPSLYNDPALAARVKQTLIKTLGAPNVFDDPRMMGSEDVGIFGLDGKIPVTYYLARSHVSRPLRRRPGRRQRPPRPPHQPLRT